MDFKSRFESHPVVFGLGLIVVAFVAGFSARGYFPSSVEVSSHTTTCNIEGVEALAQGHNNRMGLLQKSLAVYETKASDYAIFPSNQENYRASADRVRKDISEEISNFRVSVESLSKKCAD